MNAQLAFTVGTLSGAEALLHRFDCMPVQADTDDDAHMPDRMRAAAEPIKPVRLARPRNDALGKMCRVEDEACGIGEEGRQGRF